MAWFRVDDGLHSHPKWLGLPKGARALWVTAGSWSSHQLNDGRVPISALRILDGTPKEAQALVDAGLWEPNCDGWIFHDWDQLNPSREEVLAKRAKSAERLRRWREQKGLTDAM